MAVALNLDFPFLAVLTIFQLILLCSEEAQSILFLFVFCTQTAVSAVGHHTVPWLQTHSITGLFQGGVFEWHIPFFIALYEK